MADGHAEYWKWKGRETINMPRMLSPNLNNPNLDDEFLGSSDTKKDYVPETANGVYDLQRLQKATWGRLGYTLDSEGAP